jgi:hypothetical protein
MTPKEKAKELYWNFYQNVSDTSFPEETAKKLALIAVDEILKSGIEIDYYFDKSIGYYLSYLEYYARS